MKRSHCIRIFGRELQVRTSAPQETVEEVQALVNGKIAEAEAAVQGGDAQMVAILAMMNIAESYLSLLREREESRKLCTEKVSRLVGLMESRLR